MKNKMNRCCCDDELPARCIICSDCQTDQGSYGEWHRVETPHPDYESTGFHALGRVIGTFTIADEEAAFHVAVDFADQDEHYEIVYRKGTYSDQIEIVIYVVQGGLPTEVSSRQLNVNTNATQSEAIFCVEFGLNAITATVDYPLGRGGTLVVTKTVEFDSGYVAYYSSGNASGEITNYYRHSSEVGEEGECLSCPPVDLGEPCTCCPSGIDAVWQVDLTGFTLSDGNWNACNEIANVYILDRLPTPCAAEYRETFPLSYISDDTCFGPFDTIFTVLLSVFESENNCVMQVTITTQPLSPGQNCSGAGVLATYSKTGASINALCSGTHVLTGGAGSTVGLFKQCGGSVPATITVQSI